MIAQISGVVVDIGLSKAIVDVGGIGYGVLVPASILQKLKLDSPVKFHTYHHVRENTQELYGFDTLLAKELFEQLIGVSGVGPKSALAIMGLAEQDRLRSAIASEDIAFIASAPGVGKRTAERIGVELKDKVGVLAHDTNRPAELDDARAALEALGYNPAQAAQALAGISSDLPTEARVKQALKQLS